MNTVIRLVVWVVLIQLAWAVPLAGAAPPAQGRVLVLTNERTLEGEIDKIGDQYRVRRTLGETWVPAKQALRVCADWADAYTFLRGRSNGNDPDERVRMARWCHEHGLRQQAIDEVKAAVVLDPDHRDARRLLASLQRAVTVPVEAAPPAPVPSTPVPAVAVDLSAECTTLFATRVQPILMNACARCHTGDQGGAFRLAWAHGDSLGNRPTLQRNLAAVLSQVNLGQPANSPLLSKAASAHGALVQAPLGRRQAAAFRTLEQWVRLAAESQPRSAAAVEMKESPFAASVSAPPPAAPTPTAEPVSLSKPPAADKPAAAEKPPAVEQPSEPADPFDPSIFNRKLHPQR